jgi:hypothetical protein
MRLVIVKHVRLKCGTERLHGTDGDKMRYFNEFFAFFLRFRVLDLCFMELMQRRSA